MNSNRRKALQIIIDKVEELKSELETLMDEEQEYFDNMPESFQYGEKGEKSETAIGEMESAVSSFDDIVLNIQTAME